MSADTLDDPLIKEGDLVWSRPSMKLFIRDNDGSEKSRDLSPKTPAVVVSMRSRLGYSGSIIVFISGIVGEASIGLFVRADGSEL
jgi:hypothetical protein